MHATDVSNYTGVISASALAEWQANHDIGLVIAQAIDPPPGYPPGVTRDQLDACKTAGMPTDAYLYLWTNSDVRSDMRAKLGLLEGYTIGRLWLDAEDTAPATVAARRAAMWTAFQELDLWSEQHGLPSPGLYTGNWWITGYLDGDASEWAERPLWLAQYDNVDDATVVTLPKGWAECAIKQYAGTSTLAGVGQIDLNVLSESEAARVTQPAQPAEPDCSGLVNALGYISGDVIAPLRSYKLAKVKTAVAEIDRVAAQFGIT